MNDVKLNVKLIENGDVKNCHESFLNEWGLPVNTINEMITLGAEVILNKESNSVQEPIVSNIILSDEERHMDFSHSIETLEQRKHIIETLRSYQVSDMMGDFLQWLLSMLQENDLISQDRNEDLDLLIASCSGNGCTSIFPSRQLKKMFRQIKYDERYGTWGRGVISEILSKIKRVKTDNVLERRFFDELKDAIASILPDLDSRQMATELKNALLNAVDNVFPEVDSVSVEDIEIALQGYSSKTILLGEYKSEDRSIVLYYKNIEQSSMRNGTDRHNLIKIVFFHELIHAILHPTEFTESGYLPYIEEPLCEYGMLCLTNIYNNGALFAEAMKHVQEKQTCIPLFHYGYGYYIFNREQLDSDTGYGIGVYVRQLYDWKCKYLKSQGNIQIPASSISLPRKTTLESTADNYESAFLYTANYPWDKQSSLYNLLHKSVRNRKDCKQ